MKLSSKYRYSYLKPLIIAAPIVLTVATVIHAGAPSPISPGNLLVSRSVYQGIPGPTGTLPVGTPIPPNCTNTQAKQSLCVHAIKDATYPGVFDNDTVDSSFGVTSPIFLDQLDPGTGNVLNTINIPPGNGANQMVTSFPSKSEIALNLSQDGSVVTFMGYVAPVNAIDVSNANTPGVVDPTNPVGINVSRAVGQLDAAGNFTTTLSNAYSGNNGRAAALANGFYYMVGNSNNGSGTPANVVASAGAQIAVPGQAPGAPTQIGNFSITQVPDNNGNQLYPTPDKLGKDNNFRGLTIFNNTMFISKGSGGNGINTVYQVGNAGALPTLGNAINAPITILPGFPTTLASAPTATNPFGLWFANEKTLYVGDEGDGTAANAATSKFAGLQKWTFANGVWTLKYVMQNGLNLGQPYSVTGTPAYPNPATDGLRNIVGRLNNDGTVTIWGVTSTVSASGDQGADPNFLVKITDNLANTDPSKALSETFSVVKAAQYGEVLRGVSFTPGTSAASAVFTGMDTSTQGNWKSVYGLDGGFVAGDGNTLPSYASVSFPTASTFVWANSTSDSRALLKTNSPTDRVAGALYSNDTFTIDVTLTDGQKHQTALYLLDFDNSGRNEKIDILDAATSRVLDSRTVSNFNNGVYAVWTLQGHVLIRVTNNGGINPVVGGIFLSTPTPPAPPSVTVNPITSPISLITTLGATANSPQVASVQFFANNSAISPLLPGPGINFTFPWATPTVPNGTYNITAVVTDTFGQKSTSPPVTVTVTNLIPTSVTFRGADTTHQGTWKGTFGGDGDLIAFDSLVRPPYAVASFNQAPTYFWANSSAPQALQMLNSPGRIASTWFGPLTFSLDVNFADGNSHQISLYFLDWDNQGRSQTVTLTDANVNGTPHVIDTETVSGFGAGKYLTWDVTGHVLIQFNKTGTGSAVVSGVFFNH
jgi:hypothetical protein